MPKQREGWEKGVGPYSNSDSGLTQAPPDPGAGDARGKDISAVVERNSNDDSGKLRPSGK